MSRTYDEYNDANGGALEVACDAAFSEGFQDAKAGDPMCLEGCGAVTAQAYRDGYANGIDLYGSRPTDTTPEEEASADVLTPRPGLSLLYAGDDLHTADLAA